MADWTMEEILRRVLLLEKENYAEYKKGADDSDIPSMKAMFRFLAEEEKKHIKLVLDKMKELNIKE
jgi:rubrerythrin